MASKRISKSAIDWARMAELVPKSQKHMYLAFKARSDGYLQRVMSYPETQPQIDWSYYRSRVAVAGLVDKFEKEYKSFQVPYPKDTQSAEIGKMEQEVMKNVEQYCKDSEKRIEEYKQKRVFYEALIPFDQWTMEDFADVFPDEAFDPLNRPTFWPHDEDVALENIIKH